MKKDILTLFPWPWLPTLGLLIFFVFFMALLVWVSSKAQQQEFAVAEKLPLGDGEKYE